MRTNCSSLFSMAWPSKNLITLLLTAITSLVIPVNSLQAQVEAGGQAKTSHHYNLQGLISNGGYGVTKEGKILAAANLDTPLIPASIIKLLTSLAAFDQLGADYQFKTELYLDGEDHLYIKGYGDPFLVSEEIAQIMMALKKSGISKINNIYIDDSSYQLETTADGAGSSLNPYDVASSALAVNFNTINILVGRDGSIRSGEPQTPLLSIMSRLGQDLPPGQHRINISGNPSNTLLLTGQLFRSLQKKAGIMGEGLIAHRKAPATSPVFIHYSSRKLPDLITGLLLYSNNFIANQIFLQIGARTFGYPATWSKGQQAMRNFIRKTLGPDATAINLFEGSGLSRKTRVTIRAMLRVLEMFKPHARLLQDKGGILLKSGTLTGVYSYAGYFVDNGNLDSFTIILNQGENNRDEILKILRETTAQQNQTKNNQQEIHKKGLVID